MALARVSMQQMAAIRRAAAEAGLSVSAFIRKTLDEVCNPQSLIQRDFQPVAPSAGRFTSTDPAWLERREAKRRENSLRNIEAVAQAWRSRLNEPANDGGLSNRHPKLTDKPLDE
jgi:uncharacterized protein (UPF0297 family)